MLYNASLCAPPAPWTSVWLALDDQSDSSDLSALLSPPTDGPLFCVDEKPGIGVRRPTAPDQPSAPRRLARREFEYVRNGTVDLLAGFRVNDSQVFGMVRLRHRSHGELLALLDQHTPTCASLPVGSDSVTFVG